MPQNRSRMENDLRASQAGLEAFQERCGDKEVGLAASPEPQKPKKIPT